MNRTTTLLTLVALLGCGPSSTPSDGGLEADAGLEHSMGEGGTDGGADGGLDGGTARCMAVASSCGDQAAQELDFHATVSTGAIIEEGTGGEFKTYVDARAGGLAPTMAFTYARFTATGLERVDLSDEQAASDTTWDIAFRRYLIRLNSGVSGPSCVAGARTSPGTTFEQVTAVEPSLSFNVEQYFTGTCELVEDGSGLSSPATVLSSFWSYSSCLKMTGNVFVVRLADGRHVKLQVLSYYEPTAQQTCNDTGSVPQPSGAAQLRVRWAFL